MCLPITCTACINILLTRWDEIRVQQTFHFKFKLGLNGVFISMGLCCLLQYTACVSFTTCTCSLYLLPKLYCTLKLCHIGGYKDKQLGHTQIMCKYLPVKTKSCFVPTLVFKLNKHTSTCTTPNLIPKKKKKLITYFQLYSFNLTN